MDKKKVLKIVAIIMVILCFALIIGVTFSFETTREVITIEENNEEEQNEATGNNSSMAESEILELLEEKRNNLQDFFMYATYYTISDVSTEHTTADDETYIVVTEDFFEELENMLTEELYQEYFTSFELVSKKSDIIITGDLYYGERTIFNDLYYESAIAMKDVNEEYIALVSATDGKIVSLVNIKYCEDTCTRSSYYYFTIENIDGDWKISDFTTEK